MVGRPGVVVTRVTTISTDEIFENVALLGLFEARLLGWAAAAREADLDAGCVPGIHSPSLTDFPGPGIALAVAADWASGTAALARGLCEALTRAAAAYDDSEAAIARFWSLGAAFAGWAAGAATPVLALGALLQLGPPAVVASLALAASGADPTALAEQLMRDIERDPGLLRDPRFVDVLRHLVDSVDDAAAGLVGLPAAFAGAVSSVGVRDSAAGLVALAGIAGLVGNAALRETPVRIETARPPSVARPPRGVEDMLERIPRDRSVIRVERYGLPGEGAGYIVYVPGTSDAGLTPAGDPFDMTANVTALGGGDCASEAALREALAAAGARPGDAVIAVGHSQGGLVATSLDEGSDYRVPLAVNAGGPSPAAPMGGGVVVSLEHTDDPIPALGGVVADDPAVFVRAPRALAEGDGAPGVLAAHSLDRYGETARTLDAENGAAARVVRTAIAEVTGGRPGEATEWEASRVSGPSSSRG
ncbi:hypothetical protein MN032_03655 [Agromyces atrinae]|uniref:hypothetical protein n=1 Tax=Agromyces atrinae TaxID=592376 RepID=UPI001F5AC106|nr:hypothetical protein [Agromyces atrinae]MCI2956780.1 hypothetical protein [Agromyces atrinae]